MAQAATSAPAIDSSFKTAATHTVHFPHVQSEIVNAWQKALGNVAKTKGFDVRVERSAGSDVNIHFAQEGDRDAFVELLACENGEFHAEVGHVLEDDGLAHLTLAQMR